MKLIKHILLLLLLLIVPCFCYSQTVTIKGDVVAVADGLPIDNVNILIKGTNIGVSSDKDGKFVLNNVKLPAVLKVSHLAFFSQDIALTKADVVKKNTINLNIQLSDRATSISEVIIIDKSPVYQLERLVYDFEIDDSNLYIIRNSKGKKLLQVYSFEDYLRNKISVPNECNVVEYDYSNNIVVRKKKEEEYYKVLIDERKGISIRREEFDIVERGIDKIISNREYYYGLLPNSLDTDIRYLNEFKILEPTLNNRFFYLLCNSNKSLLLYMIHKKDEVLRYTSIYYTTYHCGDWLLDKEKSFIDKNCKSRLIDNRYRLPSRFAYYKNALESIGANFEQQIQLGFFNTRQRIPVFVEAIDSNVVIVNLEMQALYTLNSKGELIEEKKIDYSFKGKDLENVSYAIFNQEKTKCYIVYKTPYTTKLKEIDLKTGKYIQTIALRTYLIEKIRIVGDYIYYTARAEGVNGFERWLYKEKVK
ncbi:MAG: carboxypeptidase-like regulatory domain-containing protein [Bacteroidales bacterium]|nr:carboxypeptidase-like regulatory domain-containing protein [Bacteroidales bacterium]MDD4685373.1 carboxypeptidase-like regulatory domain-containing protein [Bacteroidales bacterium]